MGLSGVGSSLSQGVMRCELAANSTGINRLAGKAHEDSPGYIAGRLIRCFINYECDKYSSALERVSSTYSFGKARVVAFADSVSSLFSRFNGMVKDLDNSYLPQLSIGVFSQPVDVEHRKVEVDIDGNVKKGSNLTKSELFNQADKLKNEIQTLKRN